MRPTRAETSRATECTRTSAATAGQTSLALSALEHRRAHLQAAEDLEAEAMRIDDERLGSVRLLHGSADLGVASATIALSAFGAIPVASCNAVSFGGTHQGGIPMSRFSLEE